MKRCNGCGTEKPLDEFYFTKDRPKGRCKACIADAARRRRQERRPEDIERVKGYSQKYWRRKPFLDYGVPLDEIPALLEEAEHGLCHICRCRPIDRSIKNKGSLRLQVDHDHVTNKYRGLLCTKCNTVLGLMDDNVEWLVSAAAYLLQSCDALGSQDLEELRMTR